MREKLRKLWASIVAFFTDETAFDRQVRGIKHGIAGIVLISTATVLPFTDDPMVAFNMVAGWTLKEWLVRIGSGFFTFYLASANVHKGMSIEEIKKALADDAAQEKITITPTPPPPNP